MALQSLTQTPTHEDEPLDLPFSKLSHLQNFTNICHLLQEYTSRTQGTVSPCTTFKINDLPLHKNRQWSISVLCKFSPASTFICSSVSCLILIQCVSVSMTAIIIIYHYCNSYSYSHRILMMTSLVKGFPTPLSAVHLYFSLFFPRMTFKGIVTTVLSETLFQVIVGFGFPSAEQVKVNSAGAVMFWLLEVIMLLGGPTKSKIRISTWLKSCCGFSLQAAL